MVDGIAQSPIEGTSLAYTFDAANADEPSHHRTQYFEMFGNYALYHEGWSLVDKVHAPVLGDGRARPIPTRPKPEWELYDI